jgi:quercetin dioxygenase-like cupin family protein
MAAHSQLPFIHSGVYHFDSTDVKEENGRETRKILEGTTHEFNYFEIHATTQYEGTKPKPAHTQKDIEELIIMKSGQVTFHLDDHIKTLGTGSVVLIPPGVNQWFENTGNSPATYYVLQFRADTINIDRGSEAGGIMFVNADTLTFKEAPKGGTRAYFNRPTAMCHNYEMHTTTLLHKGPSHAPHTHIDTEIILIISGHVEMVIDGETYNGGPGDLFIAESGKLHGVNNATDLPCEYFAFKWK